MGRPHEGPRSGAIEIALFASSATPSFGYLRRNLAISVSAALALVASMGVMGLRFNNFIRGKQLEKQLELARAVQQDLLPKGCARYGEVDFAACCEPAWQVGGDFYDVFPAGENRISLLVGDVSGKGIPAALLMGLMHGAIRSTKVADCGEEHAGACARLNQLLCSRTSVEHFATLFWSYYDRLSEELCYVNAGHFPPFAAGRNGDGVLEIRRLEEGGPVMGVIPLAGYQHGVASFRPGDVLVVYSDGVLEAARADGQEYGEERLLAAIRQNCGRGASELCDEIVGQVRAWVGSGELQDDLTLLVVKAGQSGELEAQMG
jgi:sigma-B regulation protein RsbU (phosphoserine phosphatase)